MTPDRSRSPARKRRRAGRQQVLTEKRFAEMKGLHGERYTHGPDAATDAFGVWSPTSARIHRSSRPSLSMRLRVKHRRRHPSRRVAQRLRG
ncbi:hypothetical protein JEQ12_012776 [Ovis aries]|uniref:Uncharacterized protein n=1 Tax=Ovis aries TaxID=9940 RepID=A0A835ZQT1_SHEEP|nr:hypothetical protein JEQ12_012776 [Ovis aries]